MKKLTVYRDQAVWERETFWIDVPDNIIAEGKQNVEDYVDEQLDLYDNSEIRIDHSELETMYSVEGQDVQIIVNHE